MHGDLARKQGKFKEHKAVKTYYFKAVKTYYFKKIGWGLHWWHSG